MKEQKFAEHFFKTKHNENISEYKNSLKNNKEINSNLTVNKILTEDFLPNYKELQDLIIFSESLKIELKKDLKKEKIAELIFCVFVDSKVFQNLHKQQKLTEETRNFYDFFTENNKKTIEEYKNLTKQPKKEDQGNFKTIGNENKAIEITTRFPPEPSGYLHIGHCKAALLNQHFVKGGVLRVRFDDTNQNKDYKIYEPIILEDLKLLGITDYKLSSTSDYFEVILEKGEQLIKQGDAYCDDTEKTVMRQERDEGIPSKNRENSVEENLKVFEELKKGNMKTFCVRAKISFNNKNKALRDPVIFRINDKAHHKTGSKFSLYPTYDMAVPVVDSLEGVTLCLRTNEFRDRNDQYHWIQKKLGLAKIKISDFGRLNFENTVLSKRKLNCFIENKLVSGWDDPRVPTIRGIIRRGMDIDALKDYILKQGTSAKNCTASWDKIWAINKKFIDPKSLRYSAIEKNDCYDVIIKNNLEEELKKAEIVFEKSDGNIFYTKKSKLGDKKVFLSDLIFSNEDVEILTEGEEFTVMGLGNFIVNKIDSQQNKIEVDANLTGDFKKTRVKLNCVSKTDSVVVKVVEYGDLIKKVDEVEETEDFSKYFNHESKKVVEFIAEAEVRGCKKGETVQFERKGFYYVDDDKEMVFNLIPFTKQKRKL